MKILELLIAASFAVLKVLLITALGSYLALPHIHILGEDARKHLNAIVFYVFNPALVSTNLAETITYQSMIKMWFMPINIMITYVAGSIFGWIIIQLTKPPSHLRGLILGCCSAGNLGNMLLIIIPAVCKEKGTPFGPNSDLCNTRGMAYASLSMAIGAIFLWSYVYNIVRISSTSSRSPLSITTTTTTTKVSEESSLAAPLIFEEDATTTLPCSISELRSEVSFAVRIRTFIKSLNLKSLFAPSTTGAIAGFVVGLIPQIRHLLIGTDAPLRVIEGSAALLGNGAIPAVTLIIGGNLLKGLQGSEMKKSIVMSIVLARYVALPLTGILIVRGATKFGLVEPDPLYQFVLQLQFAVPPAMNIGTITQLFGEGEKECSVVMLWTYAISSVSLTLWSTFFMWLVAPSI